MATGLCTRWHWHCTAQTTRLCTRKRSQCVYTIHECI